MMLSAADFDDLFGSDAPPCRSGDHAGGRGSGSMALIDRLPWIGDGLGGVNDAIRLGVMVSMMPAMGTVSAMSVACAGLMRSEGPQGRGRFRHAAPDHPSIGGKP